VLFDFDNDGNLDLFVANGNAHFEFPEEDVLMHNDGQATFHDIASRSGAYFSEKHVGRGATYGDFDNDGDLDLLISNLNDRPKLLRNDGGNSQHWLRVAVKRLNGKSDAIGARVSVVIGKRKITRDLAPTVGYLSQADPRLHFGLGAKTIVDKVIIRWPDGHVTERDGVAADQVLTVVEQVR